MGQDYKITCKYCYYNTNATTGSARSTSAEVDKFPAVCDNCKEIVSVNLLHNPISCPVCMSEKVVLIGDATSANGGKILTWDDLEIQANELEKEFEADRSNRYIRTKQKVLATIEIARIKIELAFVFRIILNKSNNIKDFNALCNILDANPDKFTSINTNSDHPITWEPVLPKVIKIFNLETLMTLYTSWKNGYILWSHMYDILKTEPKNILNDNFRSALLKLGLSIHRDDLDASHWELKNTPEMLVISDIDYSNAKILKQELLIVLDKLDQRTYWQSNYPGDRNSWIEARVGYKPNWSDQRHKCPNCNNYGLKFSPGRLFD